MAVPVTDMIVSTAEDGVVAETTSIKDPSFAMAQSDVNNVLLEIISRFSGATYAGVAAPETDPGTPLLKVFYLTTTAGEYVNFGNLTVESGKLTVLLYNGSTWEKQVLDLPPSGGGSTVNDRVSKLLYTKDDFQSGIFYNTGRGVGAFVPAPIEHEYYSAMKVRCYPGQVYKVYTAGASSARAYAVTDEWGCISQVAEPNEITVDSPATLDISEYGWLYINCMNTYLDSVKVELTVDIHSVLDIYARIHDNAIPHVPSYKNSPLPTLSDGAEIKILAIGNSYTIDGVEYLDEIASASTIDMTKFAVYQCVKSSGSLTTWVDQYEADTTIWAERKVGLAQASVTSGTLKQILSQDWDIIVLQQVSGDAIDYSTFNPSLRKLIGYIRESCTNQNVCIAWQLVWAYYSTFGNPPYGVDRYNAICKACKQMIADNGIDVVIPTGTAIQNARNTSLNTDHELTRDGSHLSYGVGRYVAACTWFCRLLTPIFNVPILGNSAVHTVTEEEKSMSTYETSDVTADNNLLCQKCAFYANINMFDVTTIE